MSDPDEDLIFSPVATATTEELVTELMARSQEFFFVATRKHEPDKLPHFSAAGIDTDELLRVVAGGLTNFIAKETGWDLTSTQVALSRFHEACSEAADRSMR